MSQLTSVGSLAETAHPRAALNAWWQPAILILLVSGLYGSILFHLAAQWARDPNFSHGFFIPVFSGFVIWQERTRFAVLSPRPSFWGLLIIAFSLGVLCVGSLGAELFLSRISLLPLLAGMVVLFFGWTYLRVVLFPLTFLVLMVPMPAIVFNQITFPLQMLASKVSATVLPLLGVPVFREGNIINLPVMPLEVAEACSGIRSLLSLLALAIIYGYLMEKRTWIRVCLALASIPIAIMANSIRIIGTGLLVQYWSPDKAEGFFHLFSGWLVFLVSLAMLFFLHRVIARRNRTRSVSH